MKLSGREDILEDIHSHPAWGGIRPGITPGFTLPDLKGGTTVVFSGNQPSFTSFRGIRLTAPMRSGRILVWLGSTATALDVVLDLQPGATGLVVLDGSGPISSTVSMHGQDHVFILSSSELGRTINTDLWGTGTASFFGRGGSCNGATFVVEGNDLSIQVGDDSMLSDGITIATSDSHGIFAIDDPTAMINMPRSVILHPHVWVGRQASIGKGRTIGAGVIVGQYAVVTRDAPAATIVAGNPARVIREGVTWTRPWEHYPPAIAEALAIIGK